MGREPAGRARDGTPAVLPTRFVPPMAGPRRSRRRSRRRRRATRSDAPRRPPQRKTPDAGGCRKESRAAEERPATRLRQPAGSATDGTRTAVPDSVRSIGAGARRSVRPHAGAAAGRATRNPRPSAAKTRRAAAGKKNRAATERRAARFREPAASAADGTRTALPIRLVLPPPARPLRPTPMPAPPPFERHGIADLRQRNHSGRRPPEKKNPRGGRASRRPVPKARRISG